MDFDTSTMDSRPQRQNGTLQKADSQEHEAPVKRLVRSQMYLAGNTLMMGVEPLTQEEFFAGGVNGISPAWTVGHLACVLDLFTSFATGCKLVLPRETYAVFNPFEIKKRDVTKAETVDPKVFPKGDILLMFRRAQVRAFDALTAFDVARWEERPSDDIPDSLPTYGAIWSTLGVHTFWHLGELTGCIPKFHGTYTLNSAINYFFDVATPNFRS